MLETMLLDIHEWEDELYYLLEGRMEFYCDDEVLSVGAGEVASCRKARPTHSIFAHRS